MGNPFCDDGPDLYVLDTQVIMSEDVVQAVHNMEELGRKQYHTFVDRLSGENTCSFYEPITRNNVPLFKSGSKASRKPQSKSASLKSDINLFSRMYISCQSREGDMDSFSDLTIT